MGLTSQVMALGLLLLISGFFLLGLQRGLQLFTTIILIFGTIHFLIIILVLSLSIFLDILFTRSYRWAVRIVTLALVLSLIILLIVYLSL